LRNNVRLITNSVAIWRKSSRKVSSRSLGDKSGKSYANMCRQCRWGMFEGPVYNYKRGCAISRL